MGALRNKTTSTIKTLKDKISTSVLNNKSAYANDKRKQLSIKDSIKYRRYYKTFVVGSSAFLLACLISSVFAPVQNSDAQEIQYDINETTGFYVRVSGSPTLSVSDLTATSLGQLASVKDTINVETNSPFGYRLLFSSSSANLTNTTNSNFAFKPTTGSITSPIALQKDTWGFAFDKTNTGVVSNGFADASKYTSASTPSVPDASSTWAAVPTTPTQISSFDNANVNTDGTNLDIYYGVNASTALAGGTYSATITYTAYSEGANDKMPTMQDFTQAQCDALTTDVATKLIDTRDLKVYNVTKLKDGNCWMTSNLALDGGRTLTPSDSNVVQNRTLPANISGDVSAEYDTPQINSSVAGQTTTTKNYDYAVVSDVKYGNLYNWNAATAGVGKQSTTGTVYESICPRGWRLPDNGGEGVNKSWGNLMKKYGYSDMSVTDEASVIAVQGAPFYLPLAGLSAGSSPNYQGRRANFWSRTVLGSDTSSAYHLYLNAEGGRFLPQNYSHKSNGFSVRCVYGENTENLMQNFTAAMCNSLSVSTASADNRKILMDSRDGKLYNISRLADNPAGTNNGTCWMVSNLALDGADSQGNIRTLTPSDSNVTQNRSLAANVTDGTASTAGVPQIFSGRATEAGNNNSQPRGNLYNYGATTAITDSGTEATSPNESICSKGWRLPTGSEYVVLANKLNVTNTSADTDDTTMRDRLYSAPFYFVPGGLYNNKFTSGQNGSYSTSSVRSDNVITMFAAWNRYVNISGGIGKDIGISVRCVTK